mmetsp:Transcript_3177/g.5686  ORF Transcript_3177/g.5686 Transcript_3177/m.5686 type:complete len:258 (+) Transcript_3177:90-863(+)
MADVQEDAFDIEKALKDFMADPTQKEIQLPHMTTGQRKQAKKLADQFPEIKCESYGFGADRKLHLFKAGDTPKKGDSQSPGDSGRSRTKSSERSTRAASGAASPESRPSSEGPASALDDVQDGNSMAPELIRVRNTFIHVESTSLADERVVQSMPHGMFSQCWLEESQKGPSAAIETAAAPRVTMPLPAAEAPKDIFSSGAEVAIEGTLRDFDGSGQPRVHAEVLSLLENDVIAPKSFGSRKMGRLEELTEVHEHSQ